jgi:hypothetical protein
VAGIYAVTNKRTGTFYGEFPARSRDQARMAASRRCKVFLLDLRAIKIRGAQ